MTTRAERLLERMTQSKQGRRVSTRVTLALQLGELAYQLRTSRGYTQQDLIEKTGMTQSAISRLESGNNGHVPGLEQLFQITEACGYTLSIMAEPEEADAARPHQAEHFGVVITGIQADPPLAVTKR